MLKSVIFPCSATELRLSRYVAHAISEMSLAQTISNPRSCKARSDPPHPQNSEIVRIRFIGLATKASLKISCEARTKYYGKTRNRSGITNVIRDDCDGVGSHFKPSRSLLHSIKRLGKCELRRRKEEGPRKEEGRRMNYQVGAQSSCGE